MSLIKIGNYFSIFVWFGSNKSQFSSSEQWTKKNSLWNENKMKIGSLHNVSSTHLALCLCHDAAKSSRSFVEKKSGMLWSDARTAHHEEAIYNILLYEYNSYIWYASVRKYCGIVQASATATITPKCIQPKSRTQIRLYYILLTQDDRILVELFYLFFIIFAHLNCRRNHESRTMVVAAAKTRQSRIWKKKHYNRNDCHSCLVLLVIFDSQQYFLIRNNKNPNEWSNHTIINWILFILLHVRMKWFS